MEAPLGLAYTGSPLGPSSEGAHGESERGQDLSCRAHGAIWRGGCDAGSNPGLPCDPTWPFLGPR